MAINIENILDGSLPATEFESQPPARTPTPAKEGIGLEEILLGPPPKTDIPCPPCRAKPLPAPPAFVPVASANPRAALEVFRTPELFDQIFSRLTEKDVLLAQRVSRQFKAGVQGSKLLQRKLFFRQREKTTPAVRPNAFVLRPILLTSKHFNKLRPAIALQDGKWKLILLAPRDRLRESRGELFHLDLEDCTFRRTHDACPGHQWPLLLKFRIPQPDRFADQASLQNDRRDGCENWKRMHLCDSPRLVVWEVKEQDRGTRSCGKLVAQGTLDANSRLGDLVEAELD